MSSLQIFRRPNRTAMSPWSGLMDIQREMNRMLTDFEVPWAKGAENFPEFDFAPSCEAEETEKEYLVRFDVPGMKREDIKVELHENQLTVSGERRQEKKETRGKANLSEILYGSFTRTFYFPTAVADAKLTADLKDGVLCITAPKVEGIKPKQIAIR